jgi:hypothetical protein
MTTAHEDQFTPAPVEVTQERAVMDALWPLLGGNHTEADLWGQIGEAVATALARHRTASAPAGEVEPVAMQRTIDRLHRELSDLRTKYVDALAAHPPAPTDLVELVTILHQYRSDMLRPPASDSRERRVAMIDAALAKHGGA